MIHAVLSAVLGAVFVVSGIAKLVAPAAWRAQAADLGTPLPVAVVVPYVELTVGATVAVQLVEPIPAIAALVLLVAFTVVIAVNLRAGRRPPCACFGAWSATPISWRDVARNGVFIAMAVAAVATT